MAHSSTEAGKKRRGRPPKSEQKRMTLADCHRILLEVAQSKTTVNNRDAGTSITTTAYYANCLTLASGSPQNRLASKNFIDLAQQAASYLDQQERNQKS